MKFVFRAQQPTGFAEIFASELDAVVIGVDYRLAPENPFPAPLGDCIDGLNWVRGSFITMAAS